MGAKMEWSAPGRCPRIAQQGAQQAAALWTSALGIASNAQPCQAQASPWL